MRKSWLAYFRGVLIERSWKLESVLFLAAGLLTSLSVANLLVMGLQSRLPDGSEQQKMFLQFILNTVGFHGATFLIVHFLLQHNGWRWGEFLGWNGRAPKKAVWQGLLVGLLALPLALGLNWLSHWTLTQLHEIPAKQHTVVLLEKSNNPVELICFGLAAILFAPVVEEILFRGVLYPFLQRYMARGLALTLSSLAFAAIHVNLLTFVPLLFLGMVLGWLAERRDNLLAPITAHALFNLANFILLIGGKTLF